MKYLVVLLTGAMILWLQPWSAATATPRVSKIEAARATSSTSCRAGFRKSTITGRCVRNGTRYTLFGAG